MTDQAQVLQVPVTPATNDDKIAGFAKNVLTELNAADDTNIEQQDDAIMGGEEEQQEAQPVEGEEEAPEPEKATPEAPEIPLVEVELDDGEVIKVPEKLKGHFMRDKDYRQKTMALAEQRKTYEQLATQAQQIAAQAQQMAPYHAQLYAMDNRANQLNQELQSQELAANDPIEYNRKQGELAILLRNRDSLASGLHQQMSALYAKQSELKTKQLATEVPKLFEEIPELAKEEERQALGKYVRDQGLSEEEFNHMNFSISATKLAWKARQFDRMVKEQAKAKATMKEKVAAAPTAAKSSRAPDPAAQTKQLRQEWKKGGAKFNDPAFGNLLRARLGIK